MKITRRVLLVVAVLAVLAALGWWYFLPRIAAQRAREQLAEVWRGPVEVEAIYGVFGDTLTLRGIELFDPVDGKTVVIKVKSIVVGFDDNISAGGKLVSVAVDGVNCDVELSPELFETTLETFLDLRNITIDSLPQKASLRNCDIHAVIPGEDGPYAIDVSELAMNMTRDGSRVELSDLRAAIAGGITTGFGNAVLGKVDDFFFQGNVAGADLKVMVAGSKLEDSATRGTIDAFIEVRGVAEGEGKPAVGAGWIDAKQAHVWDVPVFSGMLDAVGLLAREGDYFRHSRASFRIDRRKFHFSELIAVGSPVSVYGSGHMNLNASGFEANLIPRIGSGLVSDLPVVGDPTQALLEMMKGALVEVRLRGMLYDPTIEILPVPVITKPLQDFIDLISGDDDDDTED